MLKVKPDKADEFRSVMRGRVYPKLRREKGVRRIYLLQPLEKTNEFVSLTLWNNEKDADDYESARYNEYLDTIKDLLDEDPSVTKFKIESHAVGQTVKKAPARKKGRRARAR
jgi:heme-degrading monooxygenase HmoA